MRKFTLPLVVGDASVETALKTVIDSGRSGVVLEAASGDLHLVHYTSLVRAYRSRTAIDKADYDTILGVGDQPTVASQLDSIRSAGLKFGHRGVKRSIVEMVSLQVDFARRFETPSSGARCTRPNKPPATANRDWYHYYPPTARLRAKPNICRLCGSKIV